MNNAIGRRIKELRQHLGFSQTFFAEKLGKRYTAVGKYEIGEVKPSSDALTNIATAFNANINWLLTGEGEMFLQNNNPSINEKVSELMNKDFSAHDANNIVTHDRRQQLINIIIFFAKYTKHCGKTKLLKLLYFFDFLHFKETGRTVTKFDYYAYPKGPVPPVLFEELDAPRPDISDAIDISVTEGGFLKISPQKDFNEEYFSPLQMRIMRELIIAFKNTKADDMVEATHLPSHPWDVTIKEKGEWAKIDINLVNREAK